MRIVFVDVDTQVDFLFPAGALYVPGAEQIVPAIEQLNRFAAARGNAVISTVDAHAEDDPEFKIWPPHCVVETAGQAKAQRTLLDKRIVVPNAPGEIRTEGVPQIVLEKQSTDSLSNVNFGEILAGLNADRYVVYGVATDYCVRTAAMGLLKTGKPVSVVTTAVRAIREADAETFFVEFQQGGGRVTTLAEVCAQ